MKYKPLLMVYLALLQYIILKVQYHSQIWLPHIKFTNTLIIIFVLLRYTGCVHCSTQSGNILFYFIFTVIWLINTNNFNDKKFQLFKYLIYLYNLLTIFFFTLLPYIK